MAYKVLQDQKLSKDLVQDVFVEIWSKRKLLDADGRINPYPSLGEREFDENKDYLYPLPRTEILLNPNLEQNPGW